MSFDVDNQRCEMALAINCKDGDRPDWKPPSNCIKIKIFIFIIKLSEEIKFRLNKKGKEK